MLRLLSLIVFLSWFLPNISTNHSTTIGTQSKKSVGEESETGEICKFLGQNVTTRQVIEFPDNFSMSDVLTVVADYGSAKGGYFFDLFEYGQSNDKLSFYLFNPDELSTWGAYTSGANKIPLLVQGMGSVMNVQVFHNVTEDILSIITPRSTRKIDSALDRILFFNTIEILTPTNFSSYEYISICRLKEPEIELAVPPQPYTLGSTVTLQCTVTGPPFLSGYWTKDNNAVTSISNITEYKSKDESEAEHRLELKLIISSFHLHHVGLYECHAESSLMVPKKTTHRSIAISYWDSDELRITGPLSRTFGNLPATFSWRVEGYPINEVQLECNAGEMTLTTNETDEPPSRLFNLELPTELALDLVYCELVNNGSLVRQLVLTRCEDGNFLAADQFSDLCFPGSTMEGKLDF